MKFLTTTLLIALFSFQTSFGQDTTKRINTAWTTLKTQIQIRTDVVNNLTIILSKSNKVDKELLNTAELFSIDLYKYIDTLNFIEWGAISLARDKNGKLERALSEILVMIQNQDKPTTNNQLQGLLLKLRACNSKIHSAKMVYDELCNELGRDDLIFGRYVYMPQPRF